MNIQSVLRSIVLSYLMYFLVVPIGYVTRLLYTRTLTLEEFGLLYGVLGFLAFFNILVDVGFNDGFRYYSSKLLGKGNKKETAHLFWNVFYSQLLSIGVVALIVALFSPLLASHYFKYPQAVPVILIFVGMFIFFNITNSARNMLVVEDKQPLSYALELARNLIILGGSALLLFTTGASLIFYSYIWAGAAVVLAVAYYVAVFVMYPWLMQNHKMSIFDKKLTMFGGLTLVSNLGTIVFQTIDLWLIIAFLGLVGSALYSNALSVLALTDLFLSPLSVFLLPLISRHQHNKELLRKGLQLLYEVGLFLVLPLSIVLFFFASQFVFVLFGSEYAGAVPIVQIFALFILFRGFFVYNLHILTGLGKIIRKVWLLVGAIVFNVVMDLIVIKTWGLEGVAWVTGASWVIVFILSLWEISRIVEYRISWRRIVKICLAGVVFGAVLFWLKGIQFANVYVQIVLMIAIAFTAYVLVGIAIRAVRLEDIARVMPQKYRRFLNKL